MDTLAWKYNNNNRTLKLTRQLPDNDDPYALYIFRIYDSDVFGPAWR